VDTLKVVTTVDQAFLRDIVQRILAVASPEKIILFGSAAEGRLTTDSDIDLLIVEKVPGDRQQEYVRIREALRGLGCPFDIILISTEWFEESKDVIGGIAYPAHKYGKVLYGAA
jgi:predicted nucleotidyltransferase